MTNRQAQTEVVNIILAYITRTDRSDVIDSAERASSMYPHLHAMTKDSGNLRNVVSDIISGFEDIMRRVSSGEEVKS